MSLATDLVAYYSLGEASGTRNDAVGTNHLTDNNSVGSATGKISTAASFTVASSMSLSHADNTDLSTGDIDFSLQAWVYLTTNSGSYTLISKWGASAHFEYLLYYDGGINAFYFAVSSNGSASTFLKAATFGAASTATWYLVHGWHDSVNNQLGIAVNAGTPDTTSYSSGVFDSDAAFIIGARADSSLFMNGRIDEVGFWKRVLTSAERTSLYNSGNGLAYPFPGTGSLFRPANLSLGAGGPFFVNPVT